MRTLSTKAYLVLCVIASLGVLPTDRLWAADKLPAELPAEQSDKRGILGDRFSLDAGMKFWVAKWQVAQFITNTSGTTVVNTSGTSDTTPLMGPSITGTARLRDGEWFNSASVNLTWLQAGGFNLSSPAFVDGTPLNQTSATRRDYSIVGALSIWRGFGVFAGYYNMQQRLDTAPLGETHFQQSRYLSGPLVGLFGAGNVSGPLNAYGNLALGFYDETLHIFGQTLTTVKAAQGYSAELGLSLTGPSLKVGDGTIGSAIQMGFRAQIINLNVGASANNDVTWGPTFQVVARF